MAPLLTTKLRHIDTHQHWLRQILQSSDENDIEFSWIPTLQMPADSLTKRLHVAKNIIFMNLIGLEDISKCVI